MIHLQSGTLSAGVRWGVAGHACLIIPAKGLINGRQSGGPTMTRIIRCQRLIICRISRRSASCCAAESCSASILGTVQPVALLERLPAKGKFSVGNIHPRSSAWLRRDLQCCASPVIGARRPSHRGEKFLSAEREILAATLTAAIVNSSVWINDGAKRAVSFYRQVLAILTEAESVPPTPSIQGRPIR
jgi:hypothetical protein